MTSEVISDIIAAEQEAGDIVARAQTAARESVLLSQENAKLKIDERITQAKFQAKELISQKKNDLDKQADLLKQKNETKYQELLTQAALKIENAADFVAERII